jgi:hypothetical protein
MRRRELTKEQRVELARAARRVTRLEAQLRHARDELAQVAARLSADGAGVRAIALELDLGVADAHKLITVGRQAA